MDSLNQCILEYTDQLGKGRIQKAYKGLMDFMLNLRTELESRYPDYVVGNLYAGYMDMTYFAFTPPDLKEKRLKIAIVYLHEKGVFEVWLAGSNRKVQAACIEWLSRQNIGHYTLTQVFPGVDAIIETSLVEAPDFDDLEVLKRQIEQKTLHFIKDLLILLKAW